jgi:hypothetical protein
MVTYAEMYDEREKHEALDWSQVYLLAWYDDQGRGYLTTWGGSLPVYSFVVTGCNGGNIPLWDAPLPTSARVYQVPAGRDPQNFANEMGGYHAIGWKVPVKRKSR